MGDVLSRRAIKPRCWGDAAMSMKGNIYSDERCPICGTILQHDDRRQAVCCPSHPQVKASRFRVKYGRGLYRRFKSYEAASRFLNSLRCDDDRGLFDPRDYQADFPLGFETQAQKWLRVKVQEIKPNTYRDIERTIARAIAAWGQTNVKAIKFGEIEDFLLSLQVGDKTRHNVRSHLHAFFTWLSRREDIPMPTMPTIKFELGWREIIPLDVQSRILETVKDLTWERNPRIWIGIKWLATYVAIRPGEMRNLRERDIDVNGFFVVISPKEKKPKLVPMLEEDIELYRSLPLGFPDLPFFRHMKQAGPLPAGSKFSLEMFRRNWNQACKHLGIEGVDLYGGTRHSSASAMGEYFTRDDLRDHGTMHSTNKAFDRYMQHQAAPSKKIYEAIERLRKAK